MREFAAVRRLAGSTTARAARASAIVWQFYLRSRGRLMPFLRPAWGAEELAVARAEPGPEEGSALEAEFADRVGGDGAVIATSSGRTALTLALRALRAGHPGRSEVVIPSYACLALLDAVLAAGLEPVYCDVGPDLVASLASVQPALSSRTLALVIVHLGGQRVPDTEALSTAAREVGAVPIEDLCQALGGRIGDRVWGWQASMAFYSFGLGKNLMATAGGVLVARYAGDQVRREAKRLGDEDPRWSRERLTHVLRAHLGPVRPFPLRPPTPRPAFVASHGFNRMSPLDAGLVRTQLRRLSSVLAARRANAERLIEALPRGVEVAGRSSEHVWTKFSVVVRTRNAASALRAALLRQGVETEDMYVPLHLRDVGRPWARGPLPESERLWERTFNLPVRPSLTSAQVVYIGARVRQAASAEDGSP